MAKSFLITGGAGFIGSNLVKYLLSRNLEYRIVNLDLLTYAGNLENLREIENHPDYTFVKGDICDQKLIEEIFRKYAFDGVFHLAAQSHVDRSILDPHSFIKTNIEGTYTLLKVAKDCWQGDSTKRFIHVSTDEVYGALGSEGHFEETTPYSPNSPYAASKAGADHLVRAYFKTYDLPAIITNGCNNYGPYQFPEKLIPLMIHNALTDRPLPVYGDGKQVRDWIYVEDHCRALELIYQKGTPGETYCVGARSECTNLEIIGDLLDILDKPQSLMTFVKDRPGHDRRYSINPAKLESLGFVPKWSLPEGLKQTALWYRENRSWMEAVTSGEYKKYCAQQYGNR